MPMEERSIQKLEQYGSQGRPVLRSKTGRWWACSFIVGTVPLNSLFPYIFDVISVFNKLNTLFPYIYIYIYI